MKRLVNEIDSGGNDVSVFSVSQGSATTAWICVQNSPREEWWIMREAGSDLFVHPSPSSGDVSMRFHFVEGRNTGTAPEPFADAAAFLAWVVSQTGIGASQWATAIHSIS